MKCRYCDGTGTSNSCVNGTFVPCAACDGTGEEVPEDEVLYITDTNFDRITKSPEALAEFIFAVSDACFACDITSDNIPECCPFGECKASKNSVLEWLKQEGNDGEDNRSRKDRNRI